MTTSHSDSTENHVPENWTYTDEATMNAATGFVADEIGRLAYVTATGNYHRLNSIDGSGNPTWSDGIGAGSVPVITVDFTVGSEGANTINVALQVQVDAANATEKYALTAWLSMDNTDGGTPIGNPDAVSTGTDGRVGIIYTAEQAFELATNDDGAIDLDITYSGAATWYLWVKLPDGTIAISGAITFT